MKSVFYTLCFTGMLSVAANAQSLYSIASPVGLEESVPLNFSTALSYGYDDNPNSVPGGDPTKQSSSFINFSVSAGASNWDARTQYSYDVTLGGIFYLSSMKFGTQDVMSSSTARFSLVHNFDTTLRYSGTMGISYQPEPDYSAGINVGSRAGEYFHAFTDNNISKSFNTRLSWTTGFNVSTIYYDNASAKIDNRTYYRASQSLRYKWTTRAAASLTWRYEYADRVHGTDAVSNFALLGWEYALTQYTNLSFKVGPQFKYTSNTGTNANVFAEFGLNHRFTDRTSVNMFFRREDESTNTYNGNGNYGSNFSYRAGVNVAYMLNHRWTAFVGGNYINSAYRRAQEGLQNRDSYTYNFSAGLAFAATKNLVLRATYSYTDGKNDFFYGSNTYDRSVYSIGANYTF